MDVDEVTGAGESSNFDEGRGEVGEVGKGAN